MAAQRFRFSCPACSTTLRLQDRKLVGRTLPCPDCDVELELIDDGDGGIAGTLAEVASRTPGSKRSSRSRKKRDRETPSSSVVARAGFVAIQTAPVLKAIATPVGIGWMVAGTVAVVLLGSIFLGGDDDSSATTNQQSAPTNGLAESKTISVADSGGNGGPLDGKQSGEPIAGPSGSTGIEPITKQSSDSIPDVSPPPKTVNLPKVVEGNPVPSVAKTSTTDSSGATSKQPIKTATNPPVRTPNPGVVPSAQTQPSPPIEPPVASKPAVAAPVLAKPKPPVVDVQAALKQPIREYRLSSQVPLRSVLVELEEMAGVPISIDSQRIGSAAARLEDPISLSLKSTTVGEILKTALGLAQLSFTAEKSQILIVPAPKAKTE